MKTRYPDLFAIDGTASRFLGELYENTQYERTTRLESAWALFSDYSGGGWLARFPAGINPSDMSAVTAATERTYGSCGGFIEKRVFQLSVEDPVATMPSHDEERKQRILFEDSTTQWSFWRQPTKIPQTVLAKQLGCSRKTTKPG